MKRLLCVAAGASCLAAMSHAVVPAYAVDLPGNVYQIDLASAGQVLLGNTGAGALMQALAISPGGQLFGADGNGRLFSISTVNGQGTLVGNMGIGPVEGLDFNGNTLLATDSSNSVKIWSINTITAAATPVIGATSITGLVHSIAVASPTTAYLLHDSPNQDFFSKIDLTTGAVTNIAPLPNTTQRALDFGNDGNLYSLSYTGKHYLINPVTGGANMIVNTGGNDWTGVTALAPVPEPASMLTVGGLVAVALRRRKK